MEPSSNHRKTRRPSLSRNAPKMIMIRSATYQILFRHDSPPLMGGSYFLEIRTVPYFLANVPRCPAPYGQENCLLHSLAEMDENFHYNTAIHFVIFDDFFHQGKCRHGYFLLRGFLFAGPGSNHGPQTIVGCSLATRLRRSIHGNTGQEPSC